MCACICNTNHQAQVAYNEAEANTGLHKQPPLSLTGSVSSLTLRPLYANCLALAIRYT